MARSGRWSARHPWWVIGAWLIVLVLAAVGHRQLGGTYSDDFTLPGSAAGQGAAVLQAHNPGSGGQNGQLVFTVPSGTLAAQQSAVEGAVAQVRTLPDVLSASDPLSAATTSANGRTAYSTVNFSANPASLGAGYMTQVNNATAGARAAGITVSYGGQLGQAAQPKSSDLRSEAIGVLAAIVILLIGFGSVYAAGLPVVTAIIGAITGISVLGIAAAATTFASVSPTLGVMMGLGVGIDYALFLTTRHRQLVIDGADPAAAAGRTVASSGRSVMIAAATVIIAVLGLYASGITFIGQLGLAATIAVAVAALCAVTLVPAMLGLAGRGIDRFRIRRPVAESGAAGHDFWQRYARRVGNHPWLHLAGGIAVLLVLAIPVLSLQLGHVDAGATGSLAGQLDFVNEVRQQLPVIIGVVIAAAFLLLLASFRSPVLALKAAVLNFLSIGAAYGVIVAVFQWGWGSSLLGVSEKIPIESYVPMIMFAIVFGLSMDYEVFLLTRVREAWGRTRDNHASVATGLAATARVITCAALIITCVFLAFLISGNVVVKMLALGLGVSIIVDATIIRLLVVPATMFLLGRANWWTPRWLARIPALLEPLDESPEAAAAPVAATRTGR